MSISRWILKILGWKPVYEIKEPNKSVICVAPHTSNWDFIIGKLYYWSLRKKAHFLIKKEWFFFPVGIIMNKMGGVPVDRKKSTSITQQIVDEFNKREYFHIAITPEGTRRPQEKWKLGFYYIALEAGVPIQLAYLNAQKKEMGIREIYYPTGNKEKDLTYIYNYYKDAKAIKPENYIPPVYKKESK